jgi:hypothetical protein
MNVFSRGRHKIAVKKDNEALMRMTKELEKNTSACEINTK